MTDGFAGVGRQIQSHLRRLFDQRLEPDAPPLEILHAVIDDLERRVQPSERGRRVFPYTSVQVTICQPRAGGAEIEAVFASLEPRLRERFAEIRCDEPGTLTIGVRVVDVRPATWPAGRLFDVSLARAGARRGEASAPQAGAATATPSDAPAPAIAIRFDVVKGASASPSYTFHDRVVSIGRTPEPVDGLGHARRNRVVFLDTVDGVTETVGRAHAHVRRDPDGLSFSVFDDGSSNGTSIVRDGESIRVPPRDPRGIRLRDGDDLVVGRAVLRVRIAG